MIPPESQSIEEAVSKLRTVKDSILTRLGQPSIMSQVATDNLIDFEVARTIEECLEFLNPLLDPTKD